MSHLGVFQVLLGGIHALHVSVAVKSRRRLPPSFIFACSIDLFVHLPILLSDPELAVRVVSAYSAGEIGEASKVT